jgi:hypothetical protein
MPEDQVTRRHQPDFIRRHKRRRAARSQAAEEAPADPGLGRLPRITRLMALAIRFEHLLASGVVHDQAELAELGHVSRSRVTQILNLLHLAPDIQEAILDLPRIYKGRDPLAERHLRPITRLMSWNQQRAAWWRLRSAQRSPAAGKTPNMKIA